MPFYLTSRLLGCSILPLLFLGTINPSGIAQAQVVPDGTLPTNVEQIEMIRKITGGERVGNNLFHSFEEFSIPSGTEAIFENATDIQNIFSRITGSEASFIDGLLQTAGGANFFLINPNGIVFGENARLEIGGSFIGTTGNSIEFADGTSFIASGDEPKVTLTISVPIGLEFYNNNGSITVNGSGNQITNDAALRPIEFGQTPSGISVGDGKTLALIGNGINLNGGVVKTNGGNIFLTSIESGSVSISQSGNGFTFADDAITQYQDINLRQQSLIDASGGQAGNISVIGQNINLLGGSFIFAQNQASSSENLIKIKAIESLNLSGTSPDGEISSNIRSEVGEEAKEKGIDIYVSAQELTLQEGAKVQTVTSSTFEQAMGGEIDVEVSNNITLNRSTISSVTLAEGNAGNINLFTPELQLRDLSVLTSSSFGRGNGGTIEINSSSIELSGRIFGTSGRTNISASAFNVGNAGNLVINTDNLRLTGGASISSSSFSIGNAGSVIINAQESVEVSGLDETFQGTNANQSIIRSAVFAATPVGQRTFGLPEVPTGNAGDVTINTPSLNVFSEGTITVENQGTGSAGELKITSDSLNLDESGSITAAAESGLGGNIELNTQDISISNDSQITANAGGEGDGGNITINTTNLTAKKNNQITANASEGDGGNITINADSVSLNNQDSIASTSSSGNGGNLTLKTQQLQIENNSLISATAGEEGDGGNITINTDTFTLLDDSQVTANAIRGDGGNITINTAGYFVSNPDNISTSSEFGLDGTVEINVSEEDLNQSFVLPEYPLVPLEEVLAKSCFTARGPDQNRVRLNVLGKGGLPVSPDSGIDEAEDVTSEYTKVYIYSERSWQPGDPLLQVDQIVTTDDGQLLGVASARVKKCNQ